MNIKRQLALVAATVALSACAARGPDLRDTMSGSVAGCYIIVAEPNDTLRVEGSDPRLRPVQTPATGRWVEPSGMQVRDARGNPFSAEGWFDRSWRVDADSVRIVSRTATFGTWYTFARGAGVRSGIVRHWNHSEGSREGSIRAVRVGCATHGAA